MESQIEKMYENAGVKLRKVCTNVDCDCAEMLCDECEYFKDNIFAFTAEKQIELIKWLSSNNGVYIVGKYSIGFGKCIGDFCVKENFEEALAESINHLWQDITDAERTQIKNILKSEVRE